MPRDTMHCDAARLRNTFPHFTVHVPTILGRPRYLSAAAGPQVLEVKAVAPILKDYKHIYVDLTFDP